MKTQLLIFIHCLLIAAGPGYARGSEDVSTETPLPAHAVSQEDSAQTQVLQDGSTALREGDTIWLEEKIARPTRWIESLVKPLTTWMEGKVQRSGTVMESEATTSFFEAPVQPPTGDRDPTVATLTPREASELARQQVPGDVLVVKRLSTDSGEPCYRVKLISNAGEIRIFYINGHTGELMQSGKPPEASQAQEDR